MKTIALTSMLFLCAPLAQAQDFLPPEQAAAAAINALPSVRTAAVRIDSAAAQGRALDYGSHDLTLGVIPTVRTVNNGATYSEWEVSLSKAIRLPGKRRLDRDIGETGVSAAELARADARHVGARMLLQLWITWLRTAATADLARQQAETLKEERHVIERRVATGDAAKLDLDRAEAALAQALVSVERADNDREQARIQLTQQFPGLTLPSTVPKVPDPQLGAFDAEAAYRQIMESNHEIELANMLAQRGDLSAKRANADRIPDPTVGLRWLNEVDGTENAVGVMLSIPFPNKGRSATAEARMYDATAAHVEAEGVAQQVRTAARRLVEAFPARLLAWQAAKRALNATDESLQRTRRAWQLGETSYSEVLIARRQYQDAAQIEIGARLDAQEAGLQIRIDSHQLWVHQMAEGTAHALNMNRP